MSCGESKWVSAGGDMKYVHDLEDSHVVNILRYLMSKATEEFIGSVNDAGLSGYVDRRIYQLKIIEEEAIRRNMDLDEIYSTYDHPDPLDFMKRKKATKNAKKLKEKGTN